MVGKVNVEDRRKRNSNPPIRMQNGGPVAIYALTKKDLSGSGAGYHSKKTSNCVGVLLLVVTARENEKILAHLSGVGVMRMRFPREKRCW